MSNKDELKSITLVINAQEIRVKPTDNTNLMFFLRHRLRLSGTKEGCATGNCGACTVLVDNNAMQSCQLSLEAVAQQNITTIEHIISTPLGKQICESLSRYDAAQCGYCLPGIVVSAYAELTNATKPNVVSALERNLCRCGTHSRILNALRAVIDTRKALP